MLQRRAKAGKKIPRLDHSIWSMYTKEITNKQGMRLFFNKTTQENKSMPTAI